VIRRYTVELDQAALGRGLLAYILIDADLPTLTKQGKTQYDLLSDLRKIDFIQRADIVSGGTDIVAMVRVRDVAELDKVLLGRIQRIDGIKNTQSLIRIHS
jgi:Lrp/AsnC family transcriptional regulator, leucine-responsive regulatory protein